MEDDELRAALALLDAPELSREDCFPVPVSRQHTKVLLMDWPARALVIEGSANLRSSGCIEQVTARACRDLLTFHREWIEQLHATSPHGPQR